MPLSIYNNVAIDGATLREVRDKRAFFLGVLEAANMVCRNDKASAGHCWECLTVCNLSESTVGLDPA